MTLLLDEYLIDEYDKHWLTQLTPPTLKVRVIQGGPITAEQTVCTPTAQNLVASMDFSAPLDFSKIIITFVAASRENEKFPQLKIPFDFGFSHACVLAYEKGKVVINAATSVEEILRAYQMLRHALELIGPDIAVKRFNIVNEVFNVTTPFCLDLTALTNVRGELECSYRPNLFPGLIYTPTQQNGMSMLLFSSGKIVMTGVKRGQTESDETLRRYYVMFAQHAMTVEEAERRRRAQTARKQEEKRAKAERDNLLKPRVPRAQSRRGRGGGGGGGSAPTKRKSIEAEQQPNKRVSVMMPE